MCLFRAPKVSAQPLPGLAPPKSRDNASLESTPLPTNKDLLDPDDVTGVEYGSERKKQTPAAGKKVGTAALRIPLNTGTSNTGTGVTT